MERLTNCDVIITTTTNNKKHKIQRNSKLPDLPATPALIMEHTRNNQQTIFSTKVEEICDTYPVPLAQNSIKEYTCSQKEINDDVKHDDSSDNISEDDKFTNGKQNYNDETEYNCEKIEANCLVWPTKLLKAAQIKEKQVFKVYETMLHMYKSNQIMLSFNGGKDCTVVLHTLCKFYKNNALQDISLPVLYIQSYDTFPEIEKFVDDCALRYNFNLIRRKGGIKEILREVLEEMPQIKAVVMGNRSTDPYCDKLKIMQPTDADWPALMRVNPILEWTYSDVWQYILAYKVPYCCLYDHGYTSIGSVTNTIPNPHLKVTDETTGEISYKPACKLVDGSQERAGRGRTK